MGLTSSQRLLWKEELITSALESTLKDNSFLAQNKACRVFDGKRQKMRPRREKALCIVKRFRCFWEEQERNTQPGLLGGLHKRRAHRLAATQKTLNLTGRSRQRRWDRIKVIQQTHWLFLSTLSKDLLNKKLNSSVLILIKPFLKIIFRIIQFRLKRPQEIPCSVSCSKQA